MSREEAGGRSGRQFTWALLAGKGVCLYLKRARKPLGLSSRGLAQLGDTEQSLCRAVGQRWSREASGEATLVIQTREEGGWSQRSQVRR